MVVLGPSAKADIRRRTIHEFRDGYRDPPAEAPCEHDGISLKLVDPRAKHEDVEYWVQL